MEPTTEQLHECVTRHLPRGRRITGVERIRTGKFNTSYFIDTDADPLVLRIAPPSDSVFLFYERGMMRQEPGIHRLLREKTTVPVAEVIAFDDSREAIDRDYLLMERLPGEALSSALSVDPEQTLYETGRCLAQVHAVTAERYGYLGEHRPMEPRPSWAEAFREMWRRLLEDIEQVGFYTEAEREALLELLDRHQPVFDRPVPASLLHMDIWAQNILVDRAGNLTGIVDWDRALWGDPECEFAVLDYCGISEPAFWRGYGKERDASPQASVRRIFYLLYELQKYIVIRAGRNGDRASAARYRQQSLEIARSCLGYEA